MAAKSPPFWILELPPGEYDMKKLKEITGLHQNTLSYILRKFGCEERKIESGYRNLNKNIFIWYGYKGPVKKGDKNNDS